MGLRAKFIFATALAFTASVFLWPTVIAKLQSTSSKTTYEVDIRLNETIVLPCVCKGKRLSAGMTANWTGRTNVSISIRNSDDVPLNYRYAVTGGRIVGRGPNVVWDFNGSAPGEYSITVTVDDGVGGTASTTKTVRVVEPDCDCPCECPTIEVRSHTTGVRRGDNLDFEAYVAGADVKNPTYNWSVQNGVIESGQGTSALTVKATLKKNVAEVVATLEVGGTDVSCNCPISESRSVPLGKKTTLRPFEPEIRWLGLDEDKVLLNGCRYQKPNKQVSEDSLLEVVTDTWRDPSTNPVQYSYSVSGGNIVGSGKNVRWDLTGMLPGTYFITAIVTSRGKSASKERTVTVLTTACREYLQCPDVSFSRPSRIKGTNDYVIRAQVTLDWMIDRMEWAVEGGRILAGDGTKFVRIRSNREHPEVNLNLVFDEFTGCLTSHQVSW